MNIFNLLLTQPLANGLALSYKLLGGNMGIAIIAFSLFLRVILTPLTRPYMESMKKMKAYSKDLEKLKTKHKGDKSKLMQAQADFYKQKGINPGAGCLPMLLQMIILIALFRVFTSVLVSNGDVIEKFNTLLYEPLKFSSSEIINTKFLYLDVTKPDVFRLSFVPFNLPGLIIIFASLVQLISVKMTAPYIETSKNVAKKTIDEKDDIQTAMQSSMTYTFPLLTLVFGMSFPSGLALYWLLFSLTQVIVQYRSSGWGGLTPWLNRLGLLKLSDTNAKEKTKS